MGGLVVHEWIEPSGGAEKVLDSFASTFPDADIRTLWNDAPGRFPDARVTESWLARTRLRQHKAAALPFMSATWRHLDVASYDWVLASSYVFAHHVARAARDGQPVFVYAHSPARFLWAPEADPRASRPTTRLLAASMRRVDQRWAGPASYAVNSEFVRQRAREAWGVDARVIYPPVATERLAAGAWRDDLEPGEREALDSLPSHYVAGASRFVPYKRLDLVIRTAEALGLPAVVMGGGPDEPKLRAVASSAAVPVHFLVSPSDALLYSVLQGAALFVFPPVEDFGIVPIEATALGTPVLVNTIGGAAESLAVTGAGNASSFGRALRVDAERAMAADTATGQQLAIEHFDEARFAKEIRFWVGHAG